MRNVCEFRDEQSQGHGNIEAVHLSIFLKLGIKVLLCSQIVGPICSFSRANRSKFRLEVPVLDTFAMSEQAVEHVWMIADTLEAEKTRVLCE
jgi:hypothetical protein